MKQVEDAYAKILKQIRAQYTIGYVSSNPRSRTAAGAKSRSR